MSASSTPAIVVDGLCKSFQIPKEQKHTLKERVLHPFRRGQSQRFDALKNATFEVPQGEFFGIVGRNGSGKSTLLKCLAGIYRADGGQAWIRGRVSTFIELGVGFNMDLPARDNIRLNAVMLGLRSADARRREDEIIEFAGLQGFEDLKIKNYSSGMLVRLGFAIMIHVDADVLLIDEVLAVGDAAFQQKCYEQFDRIREEGRTVLLVTHDMAAVQRYCDRAILFEKGEVLALGTPERVAQEYLRVNFADRASDPRATVHGAGEEEGERWGDRGAEIVEAWFEAPPDPEATGRLPTDRPARFVCRIQFNEDVDDPVFGVVIGDERNGTILSFSSAHENEWTGHFAAGEQVTWWVEFGNVLEAGRYFATPSLARHGAGNQYLDRRDALVPVLVTNPQPSLGVARAPHRFAVERVVSAPAEGTAR